VAAHRDADVIIPAAICAGLEAAGQLMVADGVDTSEESVVAALSSDVRYRRAVQRAARDFIRRRFSHSTREVPELLVTGIVGKGDRAGGALCEEDFGVRWSYTVGGERLQGVYPVNAKQELGSAKSRLSRISRRYALMSNLTGVRVDMNDDTSAVLNTALERVSSRVVGLGVLAFVVVDGATVAVAYDPCLLYGFVNGPVPDGRHTAGELDAFAVAARHIAAYGPPMGVYDNEGLLLQGDHCRAARLWDELAVALVCGRVTVRRALLMFGYHYSAESERQLFARAQTARRDAATAGSMFL
jgi:hypothetical protein